MNLAKRMLKGKSLTVTGIVAVTLVLGLTIFTTGPSAAPTEVVEKAWPVSIKHVTPTSQRPSFGAFGRVESRREATLRLDLVAPITTVHVNEGEWVEAGTLLLEVDDREAELAVLERRAELKAAEAELRSMRSRLESEQRSAEHFDSRYALAQKKLERHQDLMAKRLIAKSLLDAVVNDANQVSIDYQNHRRELMDLPNRIAATSAAVAKADALLKRAELDLERTRLTAPFSGPVLEVFAAPGDYTSVGSPLIRIADGGAVELRVQIPDLHVERLRTASASEVVAHANGVRFPFDRLASHVRRGQTGTDAYFSVSHPDDAMMGQVLSVSVDLPEQDDLIAVPAQALYDNDKIFKVIDERLISVPVVRVGERETDELGYEVLVRGDLDAGDAIITTALPRAIDGLLVSVANGSASEASTQRDRIE